MINAIDSIAGDFIMLWEVGVVLLARERGHKVAVQGSMLECCGNLLASNSCLPPDAPTKTSLREATRQRKEERQSCPCEVGFLASSVFK
jgi:hypothetical protein